MTSTELINNNEKERENGSVTLDFATRGIRSISPGNVHLNISGNLSD